MTSTQSTNLPFLQGARMPRAELHRLLGGRLQGRISPSRQGLVLLFAAPGETESNWGDDGLFHLHGGQNEEGPPFTQGSKALASSPGMSTLLLFRVHRSGDVQFAGAPHLTEEKPWYTTDLHGKPGTPNRSRTVFRLAFSSDEEKTAAQKVLPPVLPLWPEQQDALLWQSDLDPHDTRREPGGTMKSGERLAAETLLRQRRADWLRSQGHRVARPRFTPAGETQEMIADLYDYTTGTLYAVRPNVTRDEIRDAIGTLLDLKRFLNPAALVLLLPTAPRPDLQRLLDTASVQAMWQEQNSRGQHGYLIGGTGGARSPSDEVISVPASGT